MTPDPLVAFLAARLDETEAAAKAARDANKGMYEDEGDAEWYVSAGEAICTRPHAILVISGLFGSIGPEGAHIALHDPARVLREVEAGRQLLSDYEEAVAECERWRKTEHAKLTSVVERILFMQLVNRARVYSDHEDYRPEWAPTT